MQNALPSSFVVRVASHTAGSKEVVTVATSARLAIQLVMRALDRHWSLVRREDGRPHVYRVSPGEAARRRRLAVLSQWQAIDERASAALNRVADVGADWESLPLCQSLCTGSKLLHEVKEAFATTLPEDMEAAIVAAVPRRAQGKARLRARLRLIAGGFEALGELSELTETTLDMTEAAEAAAGRHVSATLAGRAAEKAAARAAAEAAARVATAQARRAEQEAAWAALREDAAQAEALQAEADEAAIEAVLAQLFG